MEDFVLNLTNGALDTLNYGWIILFMTIESSFIPFPSEVVVIPAAYMVAETGEMSYLGVVLAGTLGSLLGALINYALSYFLGRPIVYGFANSRFGHMCLIDAQKVEKAEKFFDDHGAISTLIGRMIPAIRQLISIPAGLAKMSLGSFIGFTCLGAAIWNIILVAIGYAFHNMMAKDELVSIVGHYSHIIGITAICLVAAAIGYIIYKGLKTPSQKMEEK